jgi:uncharacterized RDD family membrane protein YckC
VPNDIVLLSLAAVFFCYFVLLKASKIGTLGYRVGRVKIVGPDGRRPGLVPLTLRLMFMTLGPLNYVIDVVWLSSDSHRQALRDKFAQTWVVNRKAEVIGTGPLLCRYYEICGYNFLFREIEEETKPTATR